jgi:CBS domain-containing protein
MDRARDAMVPDPPTLSASAAAREAGELLARPEVRAVYVCEEERLVGVVTRGTLVRDIVAAGRAPATPVREIAEPPRHAIDPELPLDEAFRYLEDADVERAPVVDEGRLVGVLSRSALQRRLAEDEPPDRDEDPGSVY